MKDRRVLLTRSFVAVLCLLGLHVLLIEPNRIVVNHIQIDDPVLHELLPGKTAMHLSDLHIKEIGRREQELLRIVHEHNPDFIFLTGDYIPWREEPEAALCFLSRLSAKFGIWAVMGDYDYSRSRRSCLFCHDGENGKPSKRHTVRFLRNSYDRLELPGGTLWIGGLDPSEADPLAPVDASPPALRKGPGILLSHSPLQFEAHSEDEEVLILAGDTHGGQIPLPTFLWRFLGYDKNACYEQGLFLKGRKKMIVSRGVGTSHLRIRLFRPPEAIILHF